jgi:hypothetical protein
MDLIRQLNDDQLALLGCAGALAAAFTIMAVSYHIGRLVRGDQQSRRVMPIRSSSPAISSAAESRPRRAA